MFSATKSMAGAMCINVVDSSQEVCCPIHPGITNWKKTFIPLRAESVAGFVGAPSAPSVVSVPSCAVLACRLRRLARWCEMVQMVSAAKHPRYTTAMFHSNQPETFPLSAGVSRPYLPSAPNKATEIVIFCFGRSKQQQQQASSR